MAGHRRPFEASQWLIFAPAEVTTCRPHQDASRDNCHDMHGPKLLIKGVTMTEWNASEYHQHSSLQQAMAEEVLRTLTLSGNESVLDIGCGDGKITAAIAARLPAGSAVGIDPSRAMIDFAARQFSRSDGNLAFEVADVRALPFQRQFDLVVSFNALHWVAEQDLALASIQRALLPGGTARLRFVCNGPRPSLEDVIETVRLSPRWAGAFAGFVKPYTHVDPEAYRTLAEKVGFRITRLDIQDVAWDFETRDNFAAFARATFVEWTRRLPEAQWSDFITDVLDAYQSLAATNADDEHTFKFYQLEIQLQSSS